MVTDWIWILPFIHSDLKDAQFTDFNINSLGTLFDSIFFLSMICFFINTLQHINTLIVGSLDCVPALQTSNVDRWKSYLDTIMKVHLLTRGVGNSCMGNINKEKKHVKVKYWVCVIFSPSCVYVHVGLHQAINVVKKH